MGGATRRFGVDERRARLGLRHRLAPGARADAPEDVAGALVAVHSSDPVSVYLGLRARLSSSDVAAIERSLYETRRLVRLIGMRRTLYVVPAEFAPSVQAAVTRGLGVAERHRLVRNLEGAGIGGDDPASWLRDLERATLGAIERRGEAAAAELTRDVPGLREQIPVGAGKPWQGTFGVSTRVLWLLAMEGRIVRTRPRGSWISSQYRWTPAERWLPGGLGDGSDEVARAEVVRRWLAANGPGTLADLRWWTGFTARRVREALATVGAAEVELDGAQGYVLADDLDGSPAPEPWVALLPALDTTTMGWADRDWYLGPHRPLIFDRNGNAGPTVWVDGRVVGGWTQRRDGEVAVRLLEDIGREAAAAIDREAEALRSWIGPARFVARFRTPLDRLLAA